MLSTHDLRVAYGGVHAVDGVSLTVDEGQLVGLIGPNGAGKTTFIDAVCGFTPSTGEMRLGGYSVDHLPPHRRARLGLVRTFQSVELFDNLNVEGNVLAAANRPSWWHPLADLVRPGRPATRRHRDLERAIELAGIGHLLDRATGELSEDERKLVGVCRALARDPRVLLLDEPAAGLDTAESRDLGDRLRTIVDAGVTILLVDHDMDLVLSRCDAVHVLEHGSLIASGTAEDVRRHERVVAAYLGTGAGAS